MANDRPFIQMIFFAEIGPGILFFSFSPLTLPLPSFLTPYSVYDLCFSLFLVFFSVAAPSRRGDLEVLGYCLLHWQYGTLPWLSVLRNPGQVQEAKAKYARFPFTSSFTGPETALGRVCGGC